MAGADNAKAGMASAKAVKVLLRVVIVLILCLVAFAGGYHSRSGEWQPVAYSMYS